MDPEFKKALYDVCQEMYNEEITKPGVQWHGCGIDPENPEDLLKVVVAHSCAKDVLEEGKS